MRLYGHAAQELATPGARLPLADHLSGFGTNGAEARFSGRDRRFWAPFDQDRIFRAAKGFFWRLIRSSSLRAHAVDAAARRTTTAPVTRLTRRRGVPLMARFGIFSTRCFQRTPRFSSIVETAVESRDRHPLVPVASRLPVT